MCSIRPKRRLNYRYMYLTSRNKYPCSNTASQLRPLSLPPPSPSLPLPPPPSLPPSPPPPPPPPPCTAMAGNIIPAIATTNAVIAGLIVMEVLKVLAGDFGKCKQVSIQYVAP